MTKSSPDRRIFWINVAAVILSILAASSIGLAIYGYQTQHTGGSGGLSNANISGPSAGSPGGGGGGGQSTNTGTSSSTLPTAITLVETMNVWNQTAQQPSFFLLGPNGLESAASITLPAKKQIQLTIVSYDSPTPGSTDQQGTVQGTVGGNVYFMNGTIATVGNATWGKTITSVKGDALAHTFTVQQLGINIPVIGGSTVIAYLYFDKPGTFVWVCLTPCGTGPQGDQGSMSTAGWMVGQLTVQ